MSEEKYKKDQIKRTLKKLQESAIPYFKNVLGVKKLETYQEKVIKTVWENERTAVKACHDLGKTFLAARIAMAFFSVYPNSKVITTAPTFLQVEKIMWSEIRSAHASALMPLGGKLNTTDWTHAPDWFMLGFTPRNEANGGEGQGTQSSFQGFHAPHILVIFDEATGIPPPVWIMVEGLLTSGHVKFLAIGNPTSSESDFAKCFKDPAFAKVSLTCFDSPNLIANGITDKNKLKAEVEKVKAMPEVEARNYMGKYVVTVPYLLTTKWVIQNCIKWGLDHPLTLSKILGEFPRAGSNTLVPLHIVEQAQSRKAAVTLACRKSIGVDVARFGNDETVLTGLHGSQQTHLKPLFHHDTGEVVGEVIAMSKEMGGADIIVVDETGLGGGVVDGLRDEIGKSLPKNCEVRGVQFGATCDDDDDKEKYHDMKARMFGLLENDMKAETGLALLNESVYLEELPTIRKRYNRKGQMVMESKDEYKLRTGRKSPDYADSLALANFGHYDELKIGKFTKDYNKETRKTLSGGLKSKRNW